MPFKKILLAASTFVCVAFPVSALAQTSCCPFSDTKLKTDVTPLTNSTDQLLKIQGVQFKWKDSGREDIGVIAQDVQKAYPELVLEKQNHLTVDYQKLVAPLIESVRELNGRIAVLEKAENKQ